jgi:hypothetical protein
MRAKSAGARSEVADGPVLKHNVKNPMQDPRVPLLREKFGLPGDASDLAYDAKLAAAVRKFQQANELPASGNLDARTVKESDGLDARRLSHAQFCRAWPGRTRGGRSQAHADRVDLRPASASRAFPL